MPTSPPLPGASEEERRILRSSWLVQRFALGEEPGDDLSATTTMEERIAMMWPMTLDAFSHGGGPPERTPREAWPVKLRRLGEPEVD